MTLFGKTNNQPPGIDKTHEFKGFIAFSFF